MRDSILPLVTLRMITVVVLGLAVAGCLETGATRVDPYQAPGIRPTSDSSVPVGELYARECAWCHGGSGEGTARGPNLDAELDGAAYTHFMLDSGRMPIPDSGATTHRREPVFSEGQIQDLASYVAGFGGTGPDIPDPQPDAGQVAKGQELYVANCAACHSSTGRGATLTTGIDAPSLLAQGVTPTIVAEAMAIGPGCGWPDPACGIGAGAMPRFDFTPAQVDDITAYVEYLQSEGDPGGWNLGRLGPVAEGAAAVILGLGTVVSVLLWIGTRVGE